ncbi:MAG TPA: DUF2939 domain-containing protein [Caulobacteraceae bacterium]
MRLAPLVFLALMLSGCATVTRYDAAGDIHALLAAIRDNDRQAFDAHVDRPELKAQMKSRLTATAIRRGGAFGGILAQALGGVSDVLVDAAVQPQVFLAVAEAKGYQPSRPLPSRVAITSSLRYLEGDRVCVTGKKDGPCLLVFRNEAGTWRLIAFEGPLDQLRLPKAG